MIRSSMTTRHLQNEGLTGFLFEERSNDRLTGHTGPDVPAVDSDTVKSFESQGKRVSSNSILSAADHPSTGSPSCCEKTASRVTIHTTPCSSTGKKTSKNEGILEQHCSSEVETDSSWEDAGWLLQIGLDEKDDFLFTEEQREDRWPPRKAETSSVERALPFIFARTSNQIIDPRCSSITNRKSGRWVGTGGNEFEELGASSEIDCHDEAKCTNNAGNNGVHSSNCSSGCSKSNSTRISSCTNSSSSTASATGRSRQRGRSFTTSALRLLLRRVRKSKSQEKTVAESERKQRKKDSDQRVFAGKSERKVTTEAGGERSNDTDEGRTFAILSSHVDEDCNSDYSNSQKEAAEERFLPLILHQLREPDQQKKLQEKQQQQLLPMLEPLPLLRPHPLLQTISLQEEAPQLLQQQLLVELKQQEDKDLFADGVFSTANDVCGSGCSSAGVVLAAAAEKAKQPSGDCLEQKAPVFLQECQQQQEEEEIAEKDGYDMQGRNSEKNTELPEAAAQERLGHVFEEMRTMELLKEQQIYPARSRRRLRGSQQHECGYEREATSPLTSLQQLFKEKEEEATEEEDEPMTIEQTQSPRGHSMQQRRRRKSLQQQRAKEQQRTAEDGARKQELLAVQQLYATKQPQQQCFEQQATPEDATTTLQKPQLTNDCAGAGEEDLLFASLVKACSEFRKHTSSRCSSPCSKTEYVPLESAISHSQSNGFPHGEQLRASTTPCVSIERERTQDSHKEAAVGRAFAQCSSGLAIAAVGGAVFGPEEADGDDKAAGPETGRDAAAAEQSEVMHLVQQQQGKEDGDSGIECTDVQARCDTAGSEADAVVGTEAVLAAAGPAAATWTAVGLSSKRTFKKFSGVSLRVDRNHLQSAGSEQEQQAVQGTLVQQQRRHQTHNEKKQQQQQQQRRITWRPAQIIPTAESVVLDARVQRLQETITTLEKYTKSELEKLRCKNAQLESLLLFTERLAGTGAASRARRAAESLLKGDGLKESVDKSASSFGLQSEVPAWRVLLEKDVENLMRCGGRSDVVEDPFVSVQLFFAENDGRCDNLPAFKKEFCWMPGTSSWSSSNSTCASSSSDSIANLQKSEKEVCWLKKKDQTRRGDDGCETTAVGVEKGPLPLQGDHRNEQLLLSAESKPFSWLPLSSFSAEIQANKQSKLPLTDATFYTKSASTPAAAGAAALAKTAAEGAFHKKKICQAEEAATTAAVEDDVCKHAFAEAVSRTAKSLTVELTGESCRKRHDKQGSDATQQQHQEQKEVREKTWLQQQPFGATSVWRGLRTAAEVAFGAAKAAADGRNLDEAAIPFESSAKGDDNEEAAQKENCMLRETVRKRGLEKKQQHPQQQQQWFKSSETVLGGSGRSSRNPGNSKEGELRGVDRGGPEAVQYCSSFASRSSSKSATTSNSINCQPKEEIEENWNTKRVRRPPIPHATQNSIGISFSLGTPLQNASTNENSLNTSRVEQLQMKSSKDTLSKESCSSSVIRKLSKDNKSTINLHSEGTSNCFLEDTWSNIYSSCGDNSRQWTMQANTIQTTLEPRGVPISNERVEKILTKLRAKLLQGKTETEHLQRRRRDIGGKAFSAVQLRMRLKQRKQNIGQPRIAARKINSRRRRVVASSSCKEQKKAVDTAATAHTTLLTPTHSVCTRRSRRCKEESVAENAERDADNKEAVAASTTNTTDIEEKNFRERRTMLPNLLRRPLNLPCFASCCGWMLPPKQRTPAQHIDCRNGSLFSWARWSATALRVLSTPLRFVVSALGLNANGAYDRWRNEVQNGSRRGKAVFYLMDTLAFAGAACGVVYLALIASRAVFKTAFVRVHAIDGERVDHYFEGFTYRFWGKRPLYFAADSSRFTGANADDAFSAAVSSASWESLVQREENWHRLYDF